ncbi:MAG TPA: site-2 protease family protein [Candidatus Bathyarchaeia archaeon]|nr:site-2 protease family protein [Candidatus Bathyarchaeia archaeon]
MAWSFRIATVRGIPILINITLILIIPLFAYIFSVSPPPYGFTNVPNSFVYGTVAGIMIFVFVLLHELGHSLLALRYGIEVKSITLYLIGGVSAIEIPKEPRIEFRTALIGPLVSLGLGAIFLGLSFGVTTTVPNLFLQNFAYINLVLGGFNILPAFPMDGGRVLRAWLAVRRPYLQATHTAVQIGKAFAIAMAIFGLISPFLIIIAFFIYIAASDEERQTTITQTLSGVTVRDIMTTGAVTVPPSMTIAQLIEVMFRSKHASYPVVDNGILVGLVTFDSVHGVPANRRDDIMVGNIMMRNVAPVAPDDEASDVFVKLAQQRLGSIPVVQGGTVVGIITQKDVTSAMKLLGEAREQIVHPDGSVA